MGYGIQHTGSFDEDVLLRVRGTCACGSLLDRDNTLYESAGTISLARLAEMSVLAADLARCLCGAWDGRTGDSYACYRVPGAGPWIVSSSRIEDRPRTVTLTVRSRLPEREHSDDIVAVLSTVELDAAQRLGQPASVRAAWTEALFDLRLGASERSFPAGAGLSCLATTDHRHRGQLDLSALRFPDVDPADWLGENTAHDLDTGRVFCLVTIDPDAVQNEVEAEARRLGLEPGDAGRRRIRVGLPGTDFTLLLNTEQLLARAVSSGRLLRLEAGHNLQRAQQRLGALTEAGDHLLDRLRPVRSHVVPASHILILEFQARNIEIDVAAYTDAPTSEREQMLTHWEAQA